jgi:hypothetical protein
MRAMLTLFLILLAPGLHAQPDAVAKQEIEHLISRLGASGCQFNRNGTWHASSAAEDHLRRKYDALLGKNLVSTAETFIERAGTQSSTSGKPYLVKCGDASPIESAAWLTAELARYRTSQR